MPLAHPSPARRFAQLVGRSAAITAVRARIDDLADRAAPVLITGPSGSGKATVAALLHQRGARAARPFVAVSCTGLHCTRLEGDLFGDEDAPPAAPRGTTTTAGRRGAFARADGGTLFLDELGDLSSICAAKLCRVLDTGAVEHGGGRRAVDVRVIASAHDRGIVAAAGGWRAEVFARLAANTVALPALAEQLDDLPLLVAHFAARAAGPDDRPRFPAATLDYLARQPWPGNVRQLAHFVACAAVRYPGSTIDVPAAAVLLHGERRSVDRWLATAASPLPMPDRRRPPPIVAGADTGDRIAATTAVVLPVPVVERASGDRLPVS